MPSCYLDAGGGELKLLGRHLSDQEMAGKRWNIVAKKCPGCGRPVMPCGGSPARRMNKLLVFLGKEIIRIRSLF